MCLQHRRVLSVRQSQQFRSGAMLSLEGLELRVHLAAVISFSGHEGFVRMMKREYAKYCPCGPKSNIHPLHRLIFGKINSACGMCKPFTVGGLRIWPAARIGKGDRGQLAMAPIVGVAPQRVDANGSAGKATSISGAGSPRASGASPGPSRSATGCGSRNPRAAARVKAPIALAASLLPLGGRYGRAVVPR